MYADTVLADDSLYGNLLHFSCAYYKEYGMVFDHS